MSRICVRHCLKVYVSNFKFELIAEKKSQNLPSSINRKLESTNRKSQKSDSAEFYTRTKPAKTYRISI